MKVLCSHFLQTLLLFAHLPTCLKYLRRKTAKQKIRANLARQSRKFCSILPDTPIIKIVSPSDCTDPFPFLELPREIHDLIYGMLIGPDAGIENVSGHSSLLDIGYDIPRALLHANRQFHYEFSGEMGRQITYPLKL
ncbi:uncharacterized protein K441DRAFT_352594 [Cenococcum geophilum 1.58]|uniref:Uncharacterized protein n=1 Tax=Cenococcum geophilum 1.58 TaxID=794803 RepID=A0ACC8EMR4_9PEZI|nr:hypothetical protein K441DRAFT_352594 [Cenococcum geophilum 1.58]